MASSYSADGSFHKRVQSMVVIAVKHTRFIFGTWFFLGLHIANNWLRSAVFSQFPFICVEHKQQSQVIFYVNINDFMRVGLMGNEKGRSL